VYDKTNSNREISRKLKKLSEPKVYRLKQLDIDNRDVGSRQQAITDLSNRNKKGSNLCSG
jgi:hypothetical protein